MATRLKDLNDAIASIEERVKPIRDELQAASLVLEKHRNKYLRIKAKLLPRIREIEGHPDLPGSLVKLVRERNALLISGVRE